ncbi:TolC family outer membrane protein [Prosthecodimorpha staleyi]
MLRTKALILSGAALLVLAVSTDRAAAQTMLDSLSLAYSNNPSLNAQRSKTRSTDEGVAIAMSGYRPQISASASISRSTLEASRTSTVNTLQGSQPTGYALVPVRVTGTSNNTYYPKSVSLSLVQPIWHGFQTANSVKQSEAAVRAQRELTRSTEQDVLYDAAQVFMDVIRDTAIVSLRETNVKFLTEQVRAARDRFNVGEGTKTDVAQADARLQLAISQLNAARATVNASRATFRQVVGIEPKRLTGSIPIDKLLPKSVQAGLEFAQGGHPGILAGVSNVDVAAFNVKVLEAELMPSVNLQASASRSVDPSPGTNWQNSTQIGVNVTVPLYQGGAEYARIRQAKENLGTARIQLDVTRDQVRQAVIATWGQLESATASVIAYKAQVDASQLALDGVIQEQRVGQRTTLDVLNAQNELIDAQVNQVTADRNRVVAAFALASAVGKLSAENLRLKVVRVNPEEHYEQVRDKWFGLRTPDGR